jgi:hypothetical protein
VLCATLSGIEDFVEIRLFGRANGSISCGVFRPTSAAFRPTTRNDGINALDAELFKACFANWVEALRDRAPDIIAIDGKT